MAAFENSLVTGYQRLEAACLAFRKSVLGDQLPDLDDAAESLSWLGLEPTEGPRTGGPFGPYFQSQRLSIYEEHIGVLLRSGRAYRCFCSSERRLASTRPISRHVS